MQTSRGNNIGTEAEARIFWLGLIICPLIWTFFFFTSLFSLKIKWLVRHMIACAHALNWNHTLVGMFLYLLHHSVCLSQALVVASISLQVANLYGYLRCKAGGQEGQPPDTRSFMGQHFLQRVSDWLLHFNMYSWPVNNWPWTLLFQPDIIFGILWRLLPVPEQPLHCAPVCLKFPQTASTWMALCRVHAFVSCCWLFTSHAALEMSGYYVNKRWVHFIISHWMNIVVVACSPHICKFIFYLKK